jgi:hypothetical protein
MNTDKTLRPLKNVAWASRPRDFRFKKHGRDARATGIQSPQFIFFSSSVSIGAPSMDNYFCQLL